MALAVDMTGARYGLWVVLGRAGYLDANHCVMWLCRCDCGTERAVTGRNLRNGRSNGCGCANRAMPRPKREYTRLDEVDTTPGCPRCGLRDRHVCLKDEDRSVWQSASYALAGVR